MGSKLYYAKLVYLKVTNYLFDDFMELRDFYFKTKDLIEQGAMFESYEILRSKTTGEIAAVLRIENFILEGTLSNG